MGELHLHWWLQCSDGGNAVAVLMVIGGRTCTVSARRRAARDGEAAATRGAGGEREGGPNWVRPAGWVPLYPALGYVLHGFECGNGLHAVL